MREFDNGGLHINFRETQAMSWQVNWALKKVLKAWRLEGLKLGLTFDALKLQEVIQLEGPFEEVKSMVDYKAPSLDGFFMAFFQTCWKVIEDDIMDVF